MLLQGEDIYKVQTSIVELLSDLSQLKLLPFSNVLLPSIPFEPDKIPDLIYGKIQIEAAINTIFQQETQQNKADFCVYLPAENNITNKFLPFWKLSRNFEVKQIVTFLPNRTGSITRTENLELLKEIIPLSILSRGNYFAYYYFEEHPENVNINPMPYFIITPHYLLTFDSKMTVMQIQASKSVLKLYNKRFAALTKECSSLISYYNTKSIVSDLINFLNSYSFSQEKYSGYAMMVQPSLGIYCTDEIIDKNIRDDMPGRKLLVPVFKRHFKSLRATWTDINMFFTEKGLRNFAETGIVSDFPPKISKPFDVEDRLWFLRNLYNDIKSDKISGGITENEEMTIPKYLTLNCDPKNGLLLHAIQNYETGSYACDIRIEEPGIINAFSSFMKLLPSSRYVYPKENTLSVFEDVIRKLEKEQMGEK